MSFVFVVRVNAKNICTHPSAHPSIELALEFVRGELKSRTGNDYIGDISRWKHAIEPLKKKGYEYTIFKVRLYPSPSEMVIQQTKVLDAIEEYRQHHYDYPIPLGVDLSTATDDIIPWDLEFCEKHWEILRKVSKVARVMGNMQLVNLTDKYWDKTSEPMEESTW